MASASYRHRITAAPTVAPADDSAADGDDAKSYQLVSCFSLDFDFDFDDDELGRRSL